MFGFILLAIVGVLAALLVRAGASATTVAGLLIGLFVPASIAFAAWFLATPPIWTILAPRAIAIVQVADIVEPREGEPRRRSDLVDVRVRLEGEQSGRLLPLFGVAPPEGSFAGRLEAQDALRVDYPIGSSLTVRVDGAQAFVDRQDWFTTAAFVFCVIFSLLVSGVVLIIASARAGSRMAPPPRG